MRAVQEEAARTLADFVYGAMRFDGWRSQQMAVEVRDKHGPVMKVNFSFEIAREQ